MTTQPRSLSCPTGKAAQRLAPANKTPASKAPATAPIPDPSLGIGVREPDTPLPAGEGLGERVAPTLNLITPPDEASYDYVHHILIGSPQGVTDAINRLHLGHRIERHRWTPLIAVREAGIHITPAQGQVISYLIQQRPKD